MAEELMLYVYNEFVDILGVVRDLQLAPIEDEDRERLLRQWVARMGRPYEDWMTRVVTGPPVSGEAGEEVEVTIG